MRSGTVRSLELCYPTLVSIFNSANGIPKILERLQKAICIFLLKIYLSDSMNYKVV